MTVADREDRHDGRLPPGGAAVLSGGRTHDGDVPPQLSGAARPAIAWQAHTYIFIIRMLTLINWNATMKQQPGNEPQICGRFLYRDRGHVRAGGPFRRPARRRLTSR